MVHCKLPLLSFGRESDPFSQRCSHGADEVALILKETMEESRRALLKIAPGEAEVIAVDSWTEK